MLPVKLILWCCYDISNLWNSNLILSAYRGSIALQQDIVSNREYLSDIQRHKVLFHQRPNWCELTYICLLDLPHSPWCNSWDVLCNSMLHVKLWPQHVVGLFALHGKSWVLCVAPWFIPFNQFHPSDILYYVGTYKCVSCRSLVLFVCFNWNGRKGPYSHLKTTVVWCLNVHLQSFTESFQDFKTPDIQRHGQHLYCTLCFCMNYKLNELVLSTEETTSRTHKGTFSQVFRD